MRSQFNWSLGFVRHFPACLALLALCASIASVVLLSPSRADVSTNSATKTSKDAYSQPGSKSSSHNRYVRGLQAALEFHKQILARGGWPLVPDGELLRPGAIDGRVPVIRARLALSRDLKQSLAQNIEYDQELRAAMVRFQTRHGIEPDGVMGKATLAALNVTVEQRIRQISVNLQRWRELPHFLGEQYVLVNLAGFELDVIEADRSILDMRVVVGKNYRQTPTFSDAISYIELNPTWTIPASIARKDLVPKFAANPGYAATNGFRAFQDGQEIDISRVDWSSLKERPLPLSLKQDAGVNNALGSVKFMFPNKFNVYLHDTPSKELFKKTVRTFSSGCIRLERPSDLAVLLLRGNPSWTSAKIQKVISSGVTTRVNIKPSVPVHLVYMTAWLDRDGIVQFRPDIYGRDREMIAKLYGGQ